METQTTYPLSLNGDTFNALKSDYDALLRQLPPQAEAPPGGVLTRLRRVSGAAEDAAHLIAVR